MPRACRTAAGMLACVIVAGWPISDSTPPRLSARLNSFVRVSSRSAASLPPLTLTLIMPPKSRICRFASEWPGWSFRPG